MLGIYLNIKRWILTNIMNEALYLALHAPVLELDFTQFVGTHEGLAPFIGGFNGRRVLLVPAVRQGPAARFTRLVQFRVLLFLVIPSRYRVLHDVQKV
jgi:hypothetical protein